MIPEDYVSYETAKLLKEKGFDEECRAFWKEWNGEIMLCHCCSGHVFEFCHNSMLEGYNDDSELNVAAPTLQMAMKWLREEKEIFVTIGFCDYPALHKSEWIPEVCTHDSIFDEPSIIAYSTYEEACEAAIKYCLENLISDETDIR